MVNNRELSTQLHQSIIGVLWMVGWAFCINLAMVTAKFLTPNTSNAMIILMRNLFAFVFLLPMLTLAKERVFQTKQPLRQGINAVLIVSTMACTYYAYRNLPLAFATSIGFSGPLITTVFSIVFLKDEVRWQKWLWISVGYLGVLIVLHPIQVTTNSAVFILLGANILASLAIINRKILLKTDSSESILVIGNTGGLVIAAIVSLFFWQNLAFKDLILLVGIGSFGILSQYCYLNALKNGDPSFVSPFEYSRLVLAIPIGIWVFNEPFKPTVAAGGLCIVLAGIAILRLQFNKDQRL
jgi:drug/metabolite transporter (DMT)-like permease